MQEFLHLGENSAAFPRGAELQHFQMKIWDIPQGSKGEWGNSQLIFEDGNLPAESPVPVEGYSALTGTSLTLNSKIICSATSQLPGIFPFLFFGFVWMTGHRIPELGRLEKPLWPFTQHSVLTTNPCPHIYTFLTLPGVGTAPFLWAAHSRAQQLFQ